MKTIIIFCLIYIAKSKKGERHVRNWMANSNTLEFVTAWEEIHNINFKGGQMPTFKNNAENKRLRITPKIWIEETNAIGLMSKSGRSGGTYAHKDIALEFATWLSTMFKL